MNEIDAFVLSMLEAWWRWGRSGAGAPALRSSGRNAPATVLTDEEAEVIEQAVCELGRREKRDKEALLAYLRNGCDIRRAARFMGCYEKTMRIRVERALSWMNGRLVGDAEKGGEDDG